MEERRKGFGDVEITVTRFEDGEWVTGMNAPYPHRPLEWLYRRITGWRDKYGRKAQLMPWREWFSPDF